MEVDEFNVAMDDPFSRTRKGNENNPFVDGEGDKSKSSVPVEREAISVPGVSMCPVPGDSNNEQEFNERLV